MQITKQLAIFLDNRPGTLARVCDALAEAKINIYAISTSDTVDHTVIRMVVSDYRRAQKIFEEHGTLVVEDDVVMIEGDNKSGALAKIAHKLSAAKVNIAPLPFQYSPYRSPASMNAMMFSSTSRGIGLWYGVQLGERMKPPPSFAVRTASRTIRSTRARSRRAR